MSITTYEGIVENGKVRLKPGIHLPDKTKVYVVVPGAQKEQPTQVKTPHLAHPEQASDFEMEISEENPYAGLRG
jgi:hypothetical protein